MKTAYSGARIYHDGILIEDHALLAENGKTLAVVAAGDIPADATVHHLDGGILTPGFIEGVMDKFHAFFETLRPNGQISCSPLYFLLK